MAEGPHTAGRARRDTKRQALAASDVIAVALSLIWLFGVLAFFWAIPSRDGGASGRLQSVMVLIAVVLPIGMIWIAALAVRSVRVMRDESQRLRAAIDGLHQTYAAEQNARGAVVEPTVQHKLNEIARAPHKADTALVTFSTTRPAAGGDVTPEPDASVAEQPSLALGTTAEDIAPALSKPDLVRALNFPDTEADKAGFAALRRALKDRVAKQLIQASQDVLTLLSQDGIYMDDLTPDRAHPDYWRRFAQGERGKAVAALGGIRDRSCLALTAARMREDAIFRDTAHHFLRKYDQMLVAFEAEASDADLAALAETRTSRAFMLLGRVSGAFD